MIDPDALLAHARRLVGDGSSEPSEVDLRRGASAAYYAVFHHLTERASGHLVGSAPDEARNVVRRTWKHRDVKWLADQLADRSNTLAANPTCPLPKDLKKSGPLADLAASDGNLVNALRRFADLQELRHRADYDHDARFDQATVLQACEDADHVRARLNDASQAANEALFTMMVVQQGDLRPPG